MSINAVREALNDPEGAARMLVNLGYSQKLVAKAVFRDFDVDAEQAIRIAEDAVNYHAAINSGIHREEERGL